MRRTVLGLAVATALVAGVLFFMPPADDMGALLSTLDDDYELYENLDFYEWLEADANEEPV